MKFTIICTFISMLNKKRTYFFQYPFFFFFVNIRTLQPVIETKGQALNRRNTKWMIFKKLHYKTREYSLFSRKYTFV